MFCSLVLLSLYLYQVNNTQKLKAVISVEIPIQLKISSEKKVLKDKLTSVLKMRSIPSAVKDIVMKFRSLNLFNNIDVAIRNGKKNRYITNK
jgi:hypothetical protein